MDPYQLPPVNEKYSMVFYSKNLTNLNEIVRQELDNPLVQLLKLARNDVKNKSNTLIEAIFRAIQKKDTDRFNDEKGFLITNKSHYEQLMEDYFNSSDFQTNIDHCRHTAFTNEAVINYNKFVRSSLFNNSDSILIKHDLLTSYSTVIGEFMEPIILNSEDYIIDDIMDYTNKYLIKGYLVKLKAISNGEVTKNYLFVVDHTNRENIKRYIKVFNSLIEKAKASNIAKRRKNWEVFYDFKRYNLLMSNIYTPEGRLIVSKDIDYGFGLTVHKTQGSTFNNIFINLNDIVYNKLGTLRADFNLRNRLLYVALSRASDAGFILM